MEHKKFIIHGDNYYVCVTDIIEQNVFYYGRLKDGNITLRIDMKKNIWNILDNITFMKCYIDKSAKQHEALFSGNWFEITDEKSMNYYSISTNCYIKIPTKEQFAKIKLII